jgi:hypothetical protein
MTITTGPAPEPENAWAGQGAVLLDIGGDIGALVVSMPASMVGLEVEIRPVGGRRPRAGRHELDHHVPHHDHGHLAHVAVVARPTADGHVPSLVFGDLESGEYELFEKGRPDAVATRAAVSGGAVTTTAWPG